MIFTPADILIPDIPLENKNEWTAYSVIACDQFTSEPDYWKGAEKISANHKSTLDFILPEAYLGTDRENEKNLSIGENMKNAECGMKLLENSMIYLERTLPDGKIRRGIVGKVDLEEYEFTPDSTSGIRATEETVLSRIPPRVKIRKSASVEIPHIMIFSDDKKGILLGAIDKDNLETVYDFELMQGGGHVVGKRIYGDALDKFLEAVQEYENSKNGGVMYAMGDGNHSLASAKAFYEDVKNEIGAAAAENHPARYALAEIVDLGEESIEFEPIYRVVKNCDEDNLLSFIINNAEKGHKVSVVSANGEKEIIVPACHPLTVGALQMRIDEYLKCHPECSCDYIHGVESLRAIATEKGSVGFLFEGVLKEDLFDYVTENGTLPRKTFSMGEAKSKRYYLEMRKITL